MPNVILDACVLFPMYLRDTLLSTAETGLYLPYWSQKILDEAIGNLINKKYLSVEKARKLENVMKTAFPEAMVEVDVQLEKLMTNHPKDRHVLAAAVVAKAEIIVTKNIKDFQKPDLNSWNVKAQSPDDFLNDIFAEYPEIMIQVLLTQSQNYKRNPLTFDQLLDKLSNQIPGFIEKIRTSIT
ncbi:PIN domain-containing protein [Anabaena cylindrica UHCC 0172]|uniref:PIN domain-containing protein n=1 Tax=Anabaena cylindrica TaxID=1165 RepID=UPI002B2136C5|nr:PIN domain-containing protein [Anabaena cylindrica]MEA5549388.1 PIN domain-containing protein [Anabaena cylindrica UHCC 0172]